MLLHTLSTNHVGQWDLGVDAVFVRMVDHSAPAFSDLPQSWSSLSKDVPTQLYGGRSIGLLTTNHAPQIIQEPSPRDTGLFKKQFHKPMPEIEEYRQKQILFEMVCHQRNRFRQKPNIPTAYDEVVRNPLQRPDEIEGILIKGYRMLRGHPELLRADELAQRCDQARLYREKNGFGMDALSNVYVYFVWEQEGRVVHALLRHDTQKA